MPIYLFINPDTGETREEYQRMDEEHVLIDENGLEWKREYTPHNVGKNNNCDPFSSKQFVEKTRDQSLSVGDLWDMSADMAMKREQQAGGKDPVREKHDAKESKKRKGKSIPSSNVRTSNKSR